MIRIIFILILIAAAIFAAIKIRSFLNRPKEDRKPPVNANDKAAEASNWWEDYSENFVNEVKNRPEPTYISGTCEICGKEYTPETSTSANYLREITYEFYGKKRDRLVCSKCLSNLRKDKGVNID